MSRELLVAVTLGFTAVVALVTLGLVFLTARIEPRLAQLAFALFGLFLVAEYWTLLDTSRRLAVEHREVIALRGRLHAAAASSGGWLYALDTESRFVYSSEASRACLGYEPAELLGTEAGALLSPDEMPHIDSRRPDVTGDVETLVVRGRHRNGEDRWLQCTIAPVLDATTGETIGWSGNARPLTDAEHPGVLREMNRRSVTAMLANSALDIAFQPIVGLRDGVVLGVEALSRFPSQPDLRPDVVFDNAANAGLSFDLELLAIRRALEAASELDASVYVAVNVSPAVLANPALLTELEATGADLSRVVVEITEHVSVQDYSVLQEPRQRLRELGIRLAIDDAGSGYASLRHILALAPDVIKIDRALVADLDVDPARRALVAAVVMFALQVGATTVIGEGVETAEELAALSLLGVDAAQGYLLGPPTTSRAEWGSWRPKGPTSFMSTILGRDNPLHA